MPSGRPHQRNDPSVMASVETALSVVPRPALIARIWHWRYEFGLVAAVILGAVGIGITLGPGWLITTTVAVLATGAGTLTWPASRRYLIARAWCVITPHRIRTGCTHAWVQTRDGRVVVNDRRSHIVVLEVIRRLPAGGSAGSTPDPGWPYLDRAPGSGPDSDDGADPGELSFHSGLGHHWPLS